ncbi:uncharacterized protein [Rutidosis leptorrhynchoides]|uniref:uncharacterized protein isoform X3 n=1 Tax=Rutidosis leptorrhynchoides TaxID=125765 RepID=UPI003A99E3BB
MMKVIRMIYLLSLSMSMMLGANTGNKRQQKKTIIAYGYIFMSWDSLKTYQEHECYCMLLFVIKIQRRSHHQKRAAAS